MLLQSIFKMIDNMIWVPQQQVPQTKKIQNYIFNLADMLGRGNFSKVYKATNELTGDTVAVKVVELSSMRTPALVQLLYSEIQILKTLKHANILNCLEVFTSANNCYIITEVCNDGDLETRLRRTGFIDEPHCRKYFYDVYQGLKYLAEQNIVHRDLKVANIFLKNGAAKLADFGFAKRTTQHFKDINIGSPIYMSPQGLLEGIYGPKTDVWAFGVFMYQMTQGDTPLGFCKTEPELKYHIMIPLTADRFRRQIPNDLKDLILRCLDTNEQRRIGMKEVEFHPYMRALYNQFNRDNIAQESPLNGVSRNNALQMPQIPQRGYSPANMNSSNFKAQQAQTRGRSVDPSFERSRQQNTLNRQQSPPRNIPSTNTTINNFSTNLTANNITNQSVQSVRSNQHLNNPLKQPQNGQDILVSKLKFQECVHLLHYCRLIYKCLKQMGNSNSYGLLREYLTSWLLNALDEIKSKVSTYVQFEGSKAAQREQKMKDVVKQYFEKYNKELKRSQGIEPTLYQLNQLLIKALSEMETKWSVVDDDTNHTMCNYFITILQANKALETSIQSHNYKPLVTNINIESFLNSTQKSSRTFNGEDIRTHLGKILVA